MWLVATFAYPMLNADIVGSIGDVTFDDGNPAKMTLRHRLILVPVVNAVSFVGAVLSVDIQPILAFGGAMGMCILGIALPAMYRLIVSGDRMSVAENAFYVAFMVFGFACTIQSMRDLVEHYKANAR